MPYEIKPTSKCGQNEVGLFNEETGEFYGCHDDKDSAQDQIAVIESNKTMEAENILVSPTFRAVKDLDDKGTFGEYLVVFGSKEEYDLEGDYFTKDTDFWLDIAENKSAVLFGHGMDEVFGTKRLDKGGAKLKKDDEGIWLETQLQRRNKYEEMVQKLAKQGKLGLSSGTAQHLVKRKKVAEKEDKRIHEIKNWPLGFDATLTPTPAEPRVGRVRPLSETDQKSIKTVAKEVLNFGVQGKANNSQVLASEMEQKAVSLREKRKIINSDFRDQFQDSTDNPTPRVYKVFDTFVIAKMGNKRWRVSYEGDVTSGYEFAERSDWTEVVEDRRFIARETAKELDEINEQVNRILGSTSQSGEVSASGVASKLDSLIEEIK